MVLLHIITANNGQALEITDMLIEKKLIVDALTMEKVFVRKRNGYDDYENIEQTLIIGKTKALLFNDIDELLRKEYGEDMPVLYSIAIVNMDWQQMDELKKEIAKA